VVRHDPHCLKVLGSSDCDTLAARYQMSLPKKYGLRAALAREHEAAERARASRRT
jgi:hypothetical protein